MGIRKGIINQYILTGGGDSKSFKEIDLQFKKLLPSKSNILLIPIGTNRKNYAYCLRTIKKTFKLLKFNKIDVCTNLKELTWDKLSLFHAIYLDGGNTFKLMNSIKESNFKKLLVKFIKNGGVVNSDSAGAIILGKRVDSAYFGDSADRNRAKLTNYNGLNLLNKYCVHCHYDESEDEEIYAYSKRGHSVLALSEDTAVYIKGERLKVIGKGTLNIFINGKKKIIKPGKTYLL